MSEVGMLEWVMLEWLMLKGWRRKEGCRREENGCVIHWDYKTKSGPFYTKG